MRVCERAGVGLAVIGTAAGLAHAQIGASGLPLAAKAAAVTKAERVEPVRASLDAAITLAAGEGEGAEERRRDLRLRWMLSNHCYPGDLSQDQLDTLVRSTRLLPLAMGRFADRYFVDSQVWFGDGLTGPGNTSRSARLTYSFPDDGVAWGATCGSADIRGTNTLNARLVGLWGSTDRGREFIRSCFASWRRYASIDYTEVADDNSPMDISIARTSTRGDIRVGGFSWSSIAAGAPLAYNAFPTTQGAGACSGGDMVINTVYFAPIYFNSTGSSYLYFRNTVTHEHGHGLGMIHSVPCDNTKLMEPFITTSFFALVQPDEVRGAIRAYGDRYARVASGAGNHSTLSAVDYGDLSTPAPRSVIERDLGTNGTVVLIPNPPNSPNAVPEDDWFKFTLSSSQPVVITVTPTGQTATIGAQSGGCGGTTSLVTASQAGNLGLELRNGSNTTVLATGAGAIGQPDVISQTLSPGTYFVRVWDQGGASAANQTVQTYDLAIQVAGAKAPPVAIAGVPVKRVQAGTQAAFIGNHNSYVTETGATITSYDWDLDGDGTFETINVPQPVTGEAPVTVPSYVSNGRVNVTLRVTDSNGKQGTDTIAVDVFGAVTTISGVSPAFVQTGTTLPITITGVNFRGVTSASQVTVSGTGVSVTGTPVVDRRGTQITGLSLVVSAGAPSGPRTLTITNADGLGLPASTGSLAGAVSVTSGAIGACCRGATCSITSAEACTGVNTRFSGAAACNAGSNRTTPCCYANFDQTGPVEVADIFAYLSAYFAGSTTADILTNGTNVPDVPALFAFLSAWFAGCP